MLANFGNVHTAWVTKTRGLRTCIESIRKFPLLLFSRKLDRFAPNKLTELGFINYPICLNYQKTILRGQVNKTFILSTDCALVSAIFCSSHSTLFRAFIIYFVYGGFQLSNPAGYRYLYTVRY